MQHGVGGAFDGLGTDLAGGRAEQGQQLGGPATDVLMGVAAGRTVRAPGRTGLRDGLVRAGLVLAPDLEPERLAGAVGALDHLFLEGVRGSSRRWRAQRRRLGVGRARSLARPRGIRSNGSCGWVKTIDRTPRYVGGGRAERGGWSGPHGIQCQLTCTSDGSMSWPQWYLNRLTASRRAIKSQYSVCHLRSASDGPPLPYPTLAS